MINSITETNFRLSSGQVVILKRNNDILGHNWYSDNSENCNTRWFASRIDLIKFLEGEKE